MCIEKSVGQGCVNRAEDVTVVQALLNMSAARMGLPAPLSMDGKIGRQTVKAIELFQRQVGGAANPDVRVDPGGMTLGLLKQGIPKELTVEKLQGILAGATEKLLRAYWRPMCAAMAASGDCSAPSGSCSDGICYGSCSLPGSSASRSSWRCQSS